MKDMYDVFKMLKENIKNYSIVFDENYKCLIVKNDIINITCDDSKISLYIKNQEVTHQHFESENYIEIYDHIIYYINNYNSILKRKKFINLFYIIIAMIIGIVIYLFFR